MTRSRAEGWGRPGSRPGGRPGSRPGGRAIAGALTALLALLALTPEPGFFARRAPIRWIPAGLDAGLGVPPLSGFFSFPEPTLKPGDRVLAVRTAPGTSPIPLDTRADLIRALNRDGVGGRVELSVQRHGRTLTLSAPVIVGDPATRAIESWPLALAGLIYLLVAFAALAGGRHPVATPMFVGSFCIGVVLLGSFDVLMPEDQGLLGFGQLRGRAALLCFTLLPAVVLHLSMRFPVVHPRFRDPALAASAYLLFAIPSAVAQLRFHDAAIVHAVELLAQSITLLALAGLLVISLASARRLKPIERSRAATLLAAGGFSALGPLAMSLADLPARNVILFAAFCVLAPPLALIWAVARYRLLDPPRWVGRALSSTLMLAAAFLVAAGAMKALPRDLANPEMARSYAFVMALLTVASYQLLQHGLRRLASGRLGAAGYEEILAEATMRLAAAASPSEALAVLEDVIRKRLGAGGLERLHAEAGEASAGALGRRGLELWRQGGSPRRGVVWLEARSEDPAPDRPELVLPLAALSGAVVLVVVSARPDGLPYTTDELRAFEALGEIATVALGHTATSAELERLVGERTESLERSLQARAAVLEAARGIQAAEEPHEVRRAVEQFLKSLAREVRWAAEPLAEAANRLVAHLEGAESSSYLLVEGLSADATAELRPQLETVCAFANLALGRLHLLDQLKREVERQSREIADITARRQHAEFVRGVAHELRKPTEEVHQLGSALADMLGGPLAAKAARIARVTREMNRRIDLLLFHSGLRFDFRRIDLVRLIDEAVERSRATNPDRHYQVHHAQKRLPLVGDASRLLSVIENLLDNALKATAEGGRVEVRSGLAGAEGAHGQEEAGSWAWIEVEDDGVGIPAGELDAIFEPGVSHFPEGFGLGLALCREVIRGHQGCIEAESRPGATLLRVLVPQFMEREAEVRR